MLRRAELRRLGIRQAHEITLLRTADLFGRLLSLQQVNDSKLPRLMDLDHKDEARIRAIHSLSKLNIRMFYPITDR
jgi:hypothetical protein